MTKTNKKDSASTSFIDTSKQTKYLKKSYSSDTILKGGYHLSFSYDDSLEYLTLKKVTKKIKEISSCSNPLPETLLGFIQADFKNYFAFGHASGLGNPLYIELIYKETGQNILDSQATWIDADTSKECCFIVTQMHPLKRTK